MIEKDEVDFIADDIEDLTPNFLEELDDYLARSIASAEDVRFVLGKVKAEISEIARRLRRVE